VTYQINYALLNLVTVTNETAMPRKPKYDRAKIKADFMQSGCTLKELAKRHSTTYRFVAELSSKEKWFEQRDNLQRDAREAATAALMKEMDSQSEAVAKIATKTAEQQVSRSMQTGDRLYTLFQAAVTAMASGDLKEMRTAIDAWVQLDNQMRKIHRIDDNEDKPLVNISVLAALPDNPPDKLVQLAGPVLVEVGGMDATERDKL
jgi:hypothetical protein